jgi:hypothetical protein
MKWKLALWIAGMFVCACPNMAGAQDVAFADRLTMEQFMALQPEAVIDFNGTRMTKRDYLLERARALEQGAKQIQARRAHADQRFEARRKAFLDAQRAKLEEYNKKVQAEVDRLVAADVAKHGSNWQARRKQAVQILDEAAKVAPEQRSELEKRANDLLHPEDSTEAK